MEDLFEKFELIDKEGKPIQLSGTPEEKAQQIAKQLFNHFMEKCTDMTRGQQNHLLIQITLI